MDLFRWYIPSGLMLLLLLMMIRSRAYKACPLFFAYVAFGVCADVARFGVRSHPALYYPTYWSTEAIFCVLGIAAMYEVFQSVLRKLDHRNWFSILFPAVIVVGITLSLARAHAVPPHVSGIVVYIVTGEIAVRFVQVLAVLLTLIPLFGLNGERYHIGIAAGFGIYSTAALLIIAKVSDFGEGYRFWWSVISVNAYSIAELVWIWSFSKRPSNVLGRNFDSAQRRNLIPGPRELRWYTDLFRRLSVLAIFPKLAGLVEFEKLPGPRD